MKKGFSFNLEGTDGSGKETQRDMLEERLIKEGLEVLSLSFPTYNTTATGRIIGQCYLGKDTEFYGWEGDTGWFGQADAVAPKIASTLYALNRLEETPGIEKAIKEGKIVLLDRYRASNMGHQAGKIIDPAEREAFIDWLENFELKVLGVHKEDQVIFLYTPWQVSRRLKEKFSHKTTEKLDMHEADIGHIQRAEKSYLEVVNKFNWPIIYCAPDGKMRSKEDIHEQVYQLFIQTLNSQKS